MRVLITGGCGYLGSVLSLVLLRANHDIRVLDNLMYGFRFGWNLVGQDGFELIRGDLRDAAALSHALRDIDAVIHLAAIVGDPACARQPSLARAVNLDASINLLEVSRLVGVKHFIFASTCSNYGKLDDESHPATEEFPLCPLSLYAETKVKVEQALLSPSGHSMNTTILRFATLYGLSPRMRFDLTVNEFALNLCRDESLVVYGEKFWRPYVHVCDAGRAVLAVLEADSAVVSGNVFNVGSDGENYRKLDLVNLIVARLGSGRVQFVHKTEDPRNYKVSFERIRSSLAFVSTRTVSDGVDEIITAVRAGLVEDAQSPAHSNTPVTREVRLS